MDSGNEHATVALTTLNAKEELLNVDSSTSTVVVEEKTGLRA
jgi:hypothetical protein